MVAADDDRQSHFAVFAIDSRIPLRIPLCLAIRNSVGSATIKFAGIEKNLIFSRAHAYHQKICTLSAYIPIRGLPGGCLGRSRQDFMLTPLPTRPREAFEHGDPAAAEPRLQRAAPTDAGEQYRRGSEKSRITVVGS